MSDLVINGGFEAGAFTGWTQVQTGSLSTSISSVITPFGVHPPHTGAYSACMICQDGGVLGANRAIYQDIVVPSGTTAQLTFWYGLTRAFSHGVAKCLICDTSDTVLATVLSQVSSTLTTPNWTMITADLSAYAGQTIRLKFTLAITVANVGNVQFSLDDIQLITTATAPDSGTSVGEDPGDGGGGGINPIGSDRRTTLRDTTNRFWSMSSNLDGTLKIVTLDGLALRDFENPVIKASNEDAYYQLSVAADGTLVTDTITGPATNRAIDYFPFVSQDDSGLTYFKLRVRQGGLLRLYETENLLPDSFPHPSNVSYSSLGGTRLIHTSCALQAIIVLADLGLWCRACNKFVLPENSNIIVVLEE